MACPRDEVVDLDAASHRRVAVEAASVLEFMQVWPHRVERGATDAEQEVVELGVIEQAPVEAARGSCPR